MDDFAKDWTSRHGRSSSDADDDDRESYDDLSLWAQMKGFVAVIAVLAAAGLAAGLVYVLTK